ncbi:MAG: hypothetical protein V1652_00695 [bacterium]
MAFSLLFPFAIVQFFSTSFDDPFDDESEKDFDSLEFDEESDELDLEDEDESEENNDDLFS